MDPYPFFAVLDGADAVGKTVLAEHFIKACGTWTPPGCPEQARTKYIHMTYIKNNREMFLANYMALLRAQKWLSMGYNVILDRGWMSENIYAGVYRGGSGLAYDVRGLDRVIRRLCGIYVVCAPVVLSAVVRHATMSKKRVEMYEPDVRIAAIAQRYRDLWHGAVDVVERECYDDYVQHIIDRGGMRMRQDAMLYDLDERGHDLDSVLNEVLDMSKERRESQIDIGLDLNSPNFVGHAADAGFVMVGDKINPNKKGRWPFIDYGASSRTISKALHVLGVDETSLMWTNANDDPDHLKEIFEFSPDIRAVALGGNAVKKCESLGVPHKSVYHPSFVGRFGRMNDFLQQLSHAFA